ncbi:MAG: 4Fe-4S dicluster domain-containing protein [candidate division WOR-3 bacterium]
MSTNKPARPRVRPHQRTGVLSTTELKRLGVVPPAARLKKGPCVMVECIENIPCNPCAYACPRKAITIEGELTDTPRVDFDKCNGCTVCIAKCPGLAIFVVNTNYSRTEATVTLPYEMLPRPEPGRKVTGLNRSGKRMCTARVIRVLDSKAQDHCAVVTVAVPKRLWNEVRSIRVPPQTGRK